MIQLNQDQQPMAHTCLTTPLILHACLSLFESDSTLCCQKIDGKSEMVSVIYNFGFSPTRPENESLF